MFQQQHGCKNKQFYVVQAKIIKAAIEEKKWYLSEKEHHDIGWDAAEEEFIQTISAGFTAGFRVAYCSMVCPLRETCEVAKKWKENNSN